MPLFNSLRSKARKNSNKRTATNKSNFTNTSTGSSDMGKIRSIFSRSPSRSPCSPFPPQFPSNNPFHDHQESPPAYSATPPFTQPAPLTPLSANSTGSDDLDDSELSFLATFDTIFLIDDSGSMTGRSWRETAAALKTITPICTKYDADGIDIHFLNARDSSEYKNITSPATVEGIFNSVLPRGGTPTGSRLHAILKPYLKELETKGEDAVKPLNIIVITDGQATDDVESVLLSAARRLDRVDAPAWQVGVQFFQVGEDEEAKDMLEKLDNQLGKKGKDKNAGNGKGGGAQVRDMVDTVPWTAKSGTKGLNGKGILKVVLGAVVRRHDDKDASSSMHGAGN